MSNGKLQGGQQYDPNYNFLHPYTEQMLDRKTANVDLGTAGEEITPNDSDSALARQYDLAAINANFANTIVSYATFISIDLPDILTSVTVILNENTGDGSSTQTGIGGSAGSFASLSLSLHSSGQGSASIQADIQYTIAVTPKDNIPAIVKVFFVNGDSTLADILTTLSSAAFFNATVQAIPLFFKTINTISLTGQQASVSATADVQERVELSFSASSGTSNVSQTLGSGTGFSVATGSSAKSVQLPATLNAGFAISQSTDLTCSASATSTLTAGTNWTGISATETAGPYTVTATVGPDIAATTPSDIPRSGLHLVKLDSTPFSGYGNNMVRAVVVDFSLFG